MRIRSAIRHSLRARLVWKVVAAAVGYRAIAIGEFWKMLQPHSVILKATVNEYDRLALPNFHAGKFSSVRGGALQLVCIGCSDFSQDEQRDGKSDYLHSAFHSHFQRLAGMLGAGVSEGG